MGGWAARGLNTFPCPLTLGKFVVEIRRQVSQLTARRFVMMMFSESSLRFFFGALFVTLAGVVIFGCGSGDNPGINDPAQACLGLNGACVGTGLNTNTDTGVNTSTMITGSDTGTGVATSVETTSPTATSTSVATSTVATIPDWCNPAYVVPLVGDPIADYTFNGANEWIVTRENSTDTLTLTAIMDGRTPAVTATATSST